MISIYDNLVDFMRDGACRYSFEDGTILYANRGLVDLLKLDAAPEDLVGKNFCDIVECEEDFLQKLNDALQETGELHSYETRLTTLQGEECWVLYEARVATDEDTGQKIVETVIRDITEHKKLERQREKEFDRLSYTLMFIHEGVIATDRDAKILYVNKIASELTDWDADEATGKKLCEILRVYDAGKKDLTENFAEEVIRSCSSIKIPDSPILISKTGREINVSVDGSCIYDRAGQIIGVVVIFRDVTEELRAEKSLEENERKFHNAVQTLFNPFAIYKAVRDERGGIVDFHLEYANDEAQNELKFHDALRGRYKACEENIKNSLVNVIERNEKFVLNDCEVVYAIKEGEEHRWFDVHAIKYEDGFEIIWRDVTENHLSKRRLEDEHSRTEDERTRLRTILDVLPIGVFISNEQGRIVQTNQAATSIWKAPEQDLLNPEKLPEIIAIAKRPDGQQMTVYDMPCNRAMRAGENIYVPEVALTFPDGTQKVLSAYGAPLRETTGRVIGGICVQVEITELKNTMQQLRDLNATLEERVAQRTAEAERRALQLRQLASALTQSEQQERRRLAQMLHDHLQQLLVGAKFNATILRGKLQDTNLVHIARQIEELLSQSIEASRSLTVELSPQVLYEAGLAPAIEWLGNWMRERQGLTVDVHADPDAEPDAEDIRVLLFQSVRELLLNVVKHSGTKAAYVSMHVVDDHIEVVVEDRGKGISGGEIDARREGRFGLLSIRERLELIGGKMLIKSEPGKGTRITVVTPRRHAQRPAIVPEQPVEVSPPTEVAPPVHKPGKIRVLLADDHEIVREGLAGLLLEEPDIEIVAEASDGQMALHLARRLHPDVIIMDVSMPRLSGVEATRKIKEEMPDIRVIVLSMHAEADMAAAMMTAGASAYLTKGGPYDALISAIRAVPAGAKGI